jgi:hypothetical protein
MNNNDEWCGKREKKMNFNCWGFNYIFDFVRDSNMMNFRFV